MPSDFEAYAVRRLDELEGRVRRGRRHQFWLSAVVAGQGILLLYLLLPVGRVGIPKYLEASHFVLLDGAGRVRGEWGMDLGQGPSFRLLTDGGQMPASFWVNHDGSANVILKDNSSGGAAILSAHPDEAGLLLIDPKGRQAGLKLDGKQPGLQQYDRPPPKPKP